MAMTPAYPGADAAGPAAPVDDQSAMPQKSGYCIEIEVDAQGQISVSVENHGAEAAEPAEGADMGDEAEPAGRPVKSIKEGLTLALEIFRADGKMPGGADDDFQAGFGTSNG